MESNQELSFTQDWSRFLTASLWNLFPRLPLKPMKVVEIGSFEGRGTRILFDRLVAHHPDSRLYCIDPWQDVYVPGEPAKFAEIDGLFVGQFARFLKNTADLGPNVVLLQGTSNQVVPMMTERLDFAYVDGDHSPDQVYRDANMLLPLMRRGGIILFDDYPWIHKGERRGDGIDRWIEDNRDSVDVIFKGYQVAVRVKSAISFAVYTVCWNEEHLLPAFLHHYRHADRIVVFDNESSDQSRDIIFAAGMEVRTFSTGGRLDDEVQRVLKNNAWKESRGSVDWVVVQDLDEFLHFPRHPGDLAAGLAELRTSGCTAAKTLAYDMYCNDSEWKAAQREKWPLRVPETLNREFRNPQPRESRQSAVTLITRGKRVTWYNYDKVLVFDPNSITEANYEPGCHEWNPLGNVCMAPDDLRPMMLHFKHLGPKQELARRISVRDRLSARNLAQRQGLQYVKTDDEHRAEVSQLYSDPAVLDIAQALFAAPWTLSRPFQGTSFAVCTFGVGDFISERLLEGRVWEPRMTSAIGTLCHWDLDTAFLDLGANVGVHSFTALASGATKVLSFECHPDTVQLLRKAYIANGWSSDRYRVIHAAISERSGNTLGFRPCRGNIGGSRITRPDERPQLGDKTVQTWALDDLALGIEGCRNVVVKMDIEGHEPEAVRGMKKLLSDLRLKSLLIELNPLMRSCEDLLQMLNGLRELGFRTTRCVLRHPPEEWSGSSLEPMRPFSVSGVWAWIASSYPELTPNDIETAIRHRTVLEIMILRI